jgi:hypothetical protein
MFSGGRRSSFFRSGQSEATGDLREQSGRARFLVLRTVLLPNTNSAPSGSFPRCESEGGVSFAG